MVVDYLRRPLLLSPRRVVVAFACLVVGLFLGWCVGWTHGSEFYRKRWVRERKLRGRDEQQQRRIRAREERELAQSTKVVRLTELRYRRQVRG